ncbi:MAG: hypothetical protein ACYDER_17065 [Ktedonobacteraceae bacterium]
MQLTEDTFGLFAQRSIQAWLIGTSTPSSEIYSVTDRPLNVLYQFVKGLQLAAAILIEAGSSYTHCLDGRPLSLSKTQRGISLTSTPYQSYCLYATTFKGIVNWPAGFYEFLDANRSLNNGGDHNWSISQMGKLSAIWHDPVWQHPSFAFLREAQVQYNFKTSTPTPSNLKLDGFVAQLEKFTGVTTVLRAARLLQAPHTLVKRLLEIGRLKPYESRERISAPSTLLWLAEVLELYRTWREAITLKEVMQWLGITRKTVVDMVEMGLLTLGGAEGLSCRDESQWMFQRENVSDCLLRIVRYVSVADVPSDTIDLMAVEMLRTDEMNAARILTYLADGRLHGYLPEGIPHTLGSLRFKPADIQVCADEDQAERERVSAEEVAMRMDMRGMKAWKVVVSRWVNAGLLTPATDCGVEWYFNRREVDVFVSQHVISKNISRMFLLRPMQITRLVHNGKLVPLSGPEIDRSPVNLFELQDLKNGVGIRVGEA